ncbi:MAG: beta-N-acetylglucosaminidase domain-containing protein, partial [Carbonactinosporaceae bacterium]
GYVLASGPAGGRWHVVLAGADPTGTYYAAQTLRQLVEEPATSKRQRVLLPGGTVRDWPAHRSRGVIEGFYGPPWSDAERRDQLAFYADHKLDTYIYAPKNDPYHRERWRRPYPAGQLDRLAGLVREARRHHVEFVFAVSPGQSVCHSGDADFRALTRKMRAPYRVGVRRFALFFDDIAAELRCPQDRRRFGDDRSPPAAAQAYLLNRFTREFLGERPDTGPLLTVPTEYSGVGASPYKRRFAELVGPGVEVFWTGREVVSPVIPDAGAGAARRVFRHPLLVWDNYPVNDFQTDRLHLGPLVGRGDDLPGSGVRGFIANPMIQAAPSKLGLATVADYAWNPGAYDPERSYEAALQELGGPAYQALRTFAENNRSSRLHGEESPELTPRIAAFREAYGHGAPQRAAPDLESAFDDLAAAPETIREDMGAPLFVKAAAPWLDKARRYGVAGRAAVRSLTAESRGDHTAAWRQRVEMHRETRAARDIPVTVGAGVIDPFLDWAREHSRVVTLDAPGQPVEAGQKVSLRARVRSGDVGVREVRWYADGKRVAERREPPYRAVWRDVPRGRSELVVEVTDETGATVRSDPVTLRAGRPDRDR